MLAVAFLGEPSRQTGRAGPADLTPAQCAALAEARERCAREILLPGRRAGPATEAVALNPLLAAYAAIAARLLAELGDASHALAWRVAGEIEEELQRLRRGRVTSNRRAAIDAVIESLGDYAELVDASARLVRRLTPAAWRELEAEIVAEAQLAIADADAPGVHVLRWQVHLLLALDAVRRRGGDLDALAWARRARDDGRHVHGALVAYPAWLAEAHRAAKRLRARNAWADWDDAEISRELAAWAPAPG